MASTFPILTKFPKKIQEIESILVCICVGERGVGGGGRSIPSTSPMCFQLVLLVAHDVKRPNLVEVVET